MIKKIFAAFVKIAKKIALVFLILTLSGIVGNIFLFGLVPFSTILGGALITVFLYICAYSKNIVDWVLKKKKPWVFLDAITKIAWVLAGLFLILFIVRFFAKVLLFIKAPLAGVIIFVVVAIASDWLSNATINRRWEEVMGKDSDKKSKK